MSDLQTILEDSHDMKTKWTTYLAFPYSRAYATALMEFKTTKGAQDLLNAKKADFGLLALTVCSGGVLTHVFAETAWKAVAAAKTLTLCKNNWDKAFNVANFASENKVASFIVGGLWDTQAHILTEKTKVSFTQTPTSFPSTQKWKTETDALTSLMGFVNECYIKYRDSARDIFSNTKITEAQKTAAIKHLTASTFANPPAKSTVNEVQIATEIELLFYLRTVMDLDYSQTFSAYAAGGVGGSSKEGKKIPIAKMPNAKDYPKATTQTHVSGGSGSVSGNRIGYEDLGRAFYDKINLLYKSLGYGTQLLSSAESLEFFNASMNKKSFLDSYTTIQRLESQGMARFNETINSGLKQLK